MGYFNDVHELADAGNGDYEYLFAGMFVILSPVAAPIWHVGLWFEWAME